MTPPSPFCRESPVVGSHVIMSVFSGYIVVGFNQRKARLTAGSTFPAAFHCRFPLRFGFKGIFCPWLLSEVILGVANSKTDNTCLPGLTLWFVCLFVCFIKGWDLPGYKKHYPSTSDDTVFRPGGGEGAGLRLPSLESWVTSKTV